MEAVDLPADPAQPEKDKAKRRTVEEADHLAPDLDSELVGRNTRPKPLGVPLQSPCRHRDPQHRAASGFGEDHWVEDLELQSVLAAGMTARSGYVGRIGPEQPLGSASGSPAGMDEEQ
jgi:hypothetical protein